MPVTKVYDVSYRMKGDKDNQVSYITGIQAYSKQEAIEDAERFLYAELGTELYPKVIILGTGQV